MNLDLLIASILLFAGALICLAGELVVPAHGFMGILCAVFAIAGVILSFIVGPAFGTISLFTTLILTPFVVAGFVKYYPHSPVGRRVLLRGPMPDKVSAVSTSQQIELAALVGQQGIALTTLRPSGTGLINEQRIACISEGPIIEKGAPIRGVAVSGGQLVVQGLER
jgi:membrane-bound ClpP family serine protease